MAIICVLLCSDSFRDILTLVLIAQCPLESKEEGMLGEQAARQMGLPRALYSADPPRYAFESLLEAVVRIKSLSTALALTGDLQRF